MSTDRTLSQEVQTYIEHLDWWNDKDLSTDERAEGEKSRKVVEVIVSDIIKSRETLSESQLAVVESLVQGDPDLIAGFLDEYYTRDGVDAVRGYVRRTMQLSRMAASRSASKTTNTYFREATRTFILGLPQACVAMCRAALEQGLKENLGYKDSETRDGLSKLIDKAHQQGLLDLLEKEIAGEVACAGNKVMHAAPADFERARETLYKLRGLLEGIYSRGNG